MHYNVNVTVRYTSVLFGKGDGVSKEFFGDFFAQDPTTTFLSDATCA